MSVYWDACVAPSLPAGSSGAGVHAAQVAALLPLATSVQTLAIYALFLRSCLDLHCRGSCAGRDICLENFSVSNGGKDLIEDASVIMAYGRRYGLIGRNGTGTQSSGCLF